MKPEISILLPSIRNDRLPAFYSSIAASTKRSFELIVVGPHNLPGMLLGAMNVKHVRDFGSPNRAQCIALSLAEGDIVTWLTDDAMLLPGAIDAHIELLRVMGNDCRNVIVGRYREGSSDHERALVHPDVYFQVVGSPASSSHITDGTWLFNVAFVHRQIFDDLGGFDPRFEGTWCAHTDLAIRAQELIHAHVQMSGIELMVCDHMPGTSGDHRPIHECQLGHDEPLIQSIYRDPDWKSKRKAYIDPSSWKSEQTIWNRRFGQAN